MPWTTPSIKTFTPVATANEATHRQRTYREAIAEGLHDLLAKDPSVFIMGEGVDDASGVFGTTLGLVDTFGKDRIVDTPIAENGITGIAMGAAIKGMRPIFIHMRPDFLLISLDQLLNHAAKWSYMSNGQVPVPLTIRCIIGRGWGSAAQHSQSIQALLTHLPGLKVVMPATAYDAKGLLVAAVRDNNPVVIMEHRWLYDNPGYVPAELYEVPIGKALVCKKGQHLTIVATSMMVHEAMRAAEELKKANIEAEVLDMRSIKPWDKECVVTSVKKTGRLIIADTGHRYGGVAAEVAAEIAERCWDSLKAPIRRITMPECPVPAAASLEELYYPNYKDIIRTAQGLLP